ncbi:MAG: 16S rRNA (guanine(966)-N(2))-methyltransferase RsmD [bacterium]|nr:16S rRNA (guanine(966)-N(2))-methyltransferase RsmD [bacterium]
MRIIAGKYKNRAIATPEGLNTRPLLTRIRKSLFDTIQPYLEGARVLDCFSGSGIVALESFSRGASYVLSIDADSAAVAIAKGNHKKICPDEDYYVLRSDVLKALPNIARMQPPFDVIGVMPPFGKNLTIKTMELIDDNPSLLKPDTVVFVQKEEGEELPLEWTHLEHVRTKKYGRNVFEYFMPPETGEENA